MRKYSHFNIGDLVRYQGFPNIGIIYSIDKALFNKSPTYVADVHWTDPIKFSEFKVDVSGTYPLGRLAKVN